MTTQTLEQTLEDFRRQCESFAREQQPRCGLIYELYQRRLSAVIDGYLAGVPAEYREELIAVARREFDYLTQDEIAEEIRQDRENDYCSHGIECNCCPLGCGDLDDY
ncbi:protein CcgAII (plasmid) [Klebsiella pneumoniae]|nr:CcgAII protein [Klebsiella pneumoniae]WJU31032.1 protein CcgAII [Klebsiella pneumoniae]